MVATRHEKYILGACGWRDLIEQAGCIPADDLVLFPDQEGKLARVILEPGDNALRADIPGGSEPATTLHAKGSAPPVALNGIWTSPIP